MVTHLSLKDLEASLDAAVVAEVERFIATLAMKYPGIVITTRVYAALVAAFSEVK